MTWPPVLCPMMSDAVWAVNRPGGTFYDTGFIILRMSEHWNIYTLFSYRSRYKTVRCDNTLSPCHRHREYSLVVIVNIFLEQPGTKSERGGVLCEDNAPATDTLQVTRSGLWPRGTRGLSSDADNKQCERDTTSANIQRPHFPRLIRTNFKF